MESVRTMPTLRSIRPKWALTTDQAAALVAALPLRGLRRGELFALRWKDIDEHARVLTVREAIYDGTFSTLKTEAGSRQIPLS
jgi:integrase